MVSATRVLASVGGGALLAFVAAVEPVPQPSTVWPTTVAGWLTAGTSIVALVTALYNMHRHRVQTAVKEAQDEAKLAAVDERLNQYRQSVDSQINGFRVSVEAQNNGLGKRVGDLERMSGEDREVVNGVLQSLAEAKENRRHVGDSLVRIEKSLADLTNAVMNRPTLREGR